jgi:H+/Cl- antiporter ClcA
MRRKRGRFDVYKVWFFAVVIGVAAAYGVIAFRFAIDAVSMLAFGETEEMAVSAAASLSFARAWAAPVMGGLVVSLILYLASRFAWLEGGRPQNVADVIEARAAYNKALIDEHIEHHK